MKNNVKRRDCTRTATVIATLAALFMVPLVTMVTSAEAHTRSRSSSIWTEHDNGNIVVTVTAPAREWTRVVAAGDFGEGLQELVGAAMIHLDATVAVFDAQGPCPAVGVSRGHLDSESRLIVSKAWACASGRPRAIRIGLFAGSIGSHIHVARMRLRDGTLREFLVGADAVTLALDAPAEGLFETLLGYARLGVEHVAFGIDHVAFVLALLLAQSGLRNALLLVTGFTLGHATSISLAAIGTIQSADRPVEVLIAASIIAVAAEAAAPRFLYEQRRAVLGMTLIAALAAVAGEHVRSAVALIGATLLAIGAAGLPRNKLTGSIAVTAVFGLAHGLGFAGALSDAGLPTTHPIGALLGFNAGIEAAQLGIVFVALTILSVVRRAAAGYAASLEAILACGLAGLGSAWLVQRLFN
ncbi:MAG: hypothetical protein ACI8TX_003318 [Hyphomicrobiaceae bacterium]